MESIEFKTHLKRGIVYLKLSQEQDISSDVALYYSHITQTDGRPTVGGLKMGKSGDVVTEFGRYFGWPTTFLSKHPS